MAFSFTWCVAVLLLAVTASEAFQWTDNLQNSTVLAACARQDVSLPWEFTLGSGETVLDIKWNYRQGARDEEMVAMSVSGNFVPMPAFSQRVQQLTNGGIVLSHVTLGSSGNYTVQMNVRQATGMVTGYSRSLSVDVADAFHVTQEPEAVYDTTTDCWHIALKCGMVANINQSYDDVLWQTPSGDLSSTKYENGYFYLHLPNPVKGGNYTCILPANVTATACVSTGAGLSPQSAIFVDEVKTRLTLLEAENTALKRYKELASKRVSFHVRLSSDKQVSNYNPVILDYVYTNEGGAYSPTTGVFTVPVSGTYALFAGVGTHEASTSANVDLVVDNVWVCYTYNKDTDHAQSSSCQAVVHLVKGQRAWLRSSGDCHYWYWATYFGGVLLRSD